MAEFTREQIFEYYRRLPEDLKEAITSVESSNAIYEIGRKYGLNIEKSGDLAREVGSVLLGITHPKDFVGHLQQALEASKPLANEIAREANARIFKQVQNNLKKLHGISAERIEFVEEKPAVLPSAAAPAKPLPPQAPPPPKPTPPLATPPPPTASPEAKFTPVPPPPAIKPPALPQMPTASSIPKLFPPTPPPGYRLPPQPLATPSAPLKIEPGPLPAPSLGGTMIRTSQEAVVRKEDQPPTIISKPNEPLRPVLPPKAVIPQGPQPLRIRPDTTAFGEISKPEKELGLQFKKPFSIGPSPGLQTTSPSAAAPKREPPAGLPIKEDNAPHLPLKELPKIEPKVGEEALKPAQENYEQYKVKDPYKEPIDE